MFGTFYGPSYGPSARNFASPGLNYGFPSPVHRTIGDFRGRNPGSRHNKPSFGE